MVFSAVIPDPIFSPHPTRPPELVAEVRAALVYQAPEVTNDWTGSWMVESIEGVFVVDPMNPGNRVNLLSHLTDTQVHALESQALLYGEDTINAIS